MKRLLFSITMMLFFFTGVSFADQIFLDDGSVLKGAIIQITDQEVEYDPEGERAFDVVAKKSVVKILHGDGRVTYLRFDALVRTDGAVINGNVIKVTGEEITYIPEGGGEGNTIPRGDIDRIEYADGTVVYIPRKGEGPGVVDDVDIEARKPTGGFHDSWVRIAGFFGFGAADYGVFDREERVLKAYRADLLRTYLIPRDYRMYNVFGAGGGEIDVMPPAIKFAQRRGFDFTGIKFGLRGRYGFQFTDSVIVDDSSYYNRVDGYELFRGRLMSYHYWTVGPVMNLIFSPRSNIMNLLVNFYATAGQVFNGKLRAAAALRHARFLTYRMLGAVGPYGEDPYLPSRLANVTNTRRFNTTRFNGYTIRCGFGPHFSLNRYFPITFGINITYAYTSLNLGRVLPVHYPDLSYFNGKRHAAHHEVGGEVSAGVHF